MVSNMIKESKHCNMFNILGKTNVTILLRGNLLQEIDVNGIVKYLINAQDGMSSNNNMPQYIKCN